MTLDVDAGLFDQGAGLHVGSGRAGFPAGEGRRSPTMGPLGAFRWPTFRPVSRR